MRWHRKLINTLGNAIDALAGPAFESDLLSVARAEAFACFEAAGIEYVSVEDEEDRPRRLVSISAGAANDVGQGASSWQSLARRTGSIEARLPER